MFKFGTGGWRDIIADGFTKENIRLLAQSLSEKMTKEGAKALNEGIVTPENPATMLLMHPDVTVLIDKDADQ